MFSSLYCERLERGSQLLSRHQMLDRNAVRGRTDSGRQTGISWRRWRASEESQLSGEADELFLHQSRALKRKGEEAQTWEEVAPLMMVHHLRWDLLVVDMRSRKRSLGNNGFSSPLKYSFSTPATELMSWSLWSSTSGSSPAHTPHGHTQSVSGVNLYSCIHAQISWCIYASVNTWHAGSLHVLPCAVGQASGQMQFRIDHKEARH